MRLAARQFGMKGAITLQALSFPCSPLRGLIWGTGIVPLHLPTRAPTLFGRDLLFSSCFHNSPMGLKDNIDLSVNQYFKAKCVMLLVLLSCEPEVNWDNLHVEVRGL